jgi:hypothetical protein
MAVNPAASESATAVTAPPPGAGVRAGTASRNSFSEPSRNESESVT